MQASGPRQKGTQSALEWTRPYAFRKSASEVLRLAFEHQITAYVQPSPFGRTCVCQFGMPGPWVLLSHTEPE